MVNIFAIFEVMFGVSKSLDFKLNFFLSEAKVVLQTRFCIVSIEKKRNPNHYSLMKQHSHLEVCFPL